MEPSGCFACGASDLLYTEERARHRHLEDVVLFKGLLLTPSLRGRMSPEEYTRFKDNAAVCTPCFGMIKAVSDLTKEKAEIEKGIEGVMKKARENVSKLVEPAVAAPPERSGNSRPKISTRAAKGQQSTRKVSPKNSETKAVVKRVMKPTVKPGPTPTSVAKNQSATPKQSGGSKTSNSNPTRQTVDSKNRFSCSKCRKNCWDKNGRTSHEANVCKLYSKEKMERLDWHRCPQCPYKTLIKSNLKQHLSSAVHRGKKNVTSQGYRKIFTARVQLKDHFRGKKEPLPTKKGGKSDVKPKVEESSSDSDSSDSDEDSEKVVA